MVSARAQAVKLRPLSDALEGKFGAKRAWPWLSRIIARGVDAGNSGGRRSTQAGVGMEAAGAWR